MIRFNNDYNRGAFDCILKALADTNTTAIRDMVRMSGAIRLSILLRGLLAEMIP